MWRWRSAGASRVPAVNQTSSLTRRPAVRRMFSTAAAAAPSSSPLEETFAPMRQRPARPLAVYHFDTAPVPYRTAQSWQREWLASTLPSVSVPASDDLPSRDALLLLQHPPVYTLGRGATEQNIRFPFTTTRPITSPTAAGASSNLNVSYSVGGDQPFELYRSERGGEVTYHAPGQLVAYPLIDLRYYRRDLHWYVRRCEEVIIRTLAPFGLKTMRETGKSGVFLHRNTTASSATPIKLAAVGIHVSRWRTSHGFSLNVEKRVLSGYDRIIPCGLDDVAVASADQYVAGLTVENVAPLLIAEFENVFNCTANVAPPRVLQPNWVRQPPA